jgi:L-aspartate oxidase
MWRQMGVERDRAGMAEALATQRFWMRAVRDLGDPEPRSWELVNMLTVAQLATIAALAREESRGVHYRRDFPSLVADWRAHSTLVPRVEGRRVTGVELVREPVAEPVRTP